VRKKIGECLIQAGLITEEDLGTALTEHKRTGERLGVVLVRMNLATEKQIAKALAFQLGFPYINLAENPPDPTAVVLIPKDVALKRVCVAVRLEKNLLTVAMSDPLLFSLVQDLEFQTGYRIKQVVATRGDINDAIETGYPDKALMVSEFGAEANRDGPAEEKGTWAFQNEWINYQLGVIGSKPWLSGAIYWALNEFWVRPGWDGGNPRATNPIHQKGLTTYDGVRKPAWTEVQRSFKSTLQFVPATQSKT